MILLCSSLLLVSIVWGMGKIQQQHRHTFFQGIERSLFMGEMLQTEVIIQDVKRAREKRVIKDIVITIGTEASSPILYQTIGTEGFPQDDSFLVETREERLSAVHPNREETYFVTYSFNVIRFGPVFLLATGLFIGFLLTFIFYIAGRTRARSKP